MDEAGYHRLAPKDAVMPLAENVRVQRQQPFQRGQVIGTVGAQADWVQRSVHVLGKNDPLTLGFDQVGQRAGGVAVATR